MSSPNTPQFEEAVKQEVELLSRQYPTPDDIPGCMKLFDQAIVCNSAFYFRFTTSLHYTLPEVHVNYSNDHNNNLNLNFHLILAASSQVRSLYRYGHMAECAQKWTDFKFCLTLRALSADERRAAWLRHRAEWWATRRTTGSSEDVWEVRKCVSWRCVCGLCVLSLAPLPPIALALLWFRGEDQDSPRTGWWLVVAVKVAGEILTGRF